MVRYPASSGATRHLIMATGSTARPERRPFPSFPQTFADERDRARLTPVAIKAMRRIAGQWHLKGHELADLLGVSPSTWDRIAAGKWDQSLSQDQLTRVS